MGRVKGTMLVEWVKTVRADKAHDYSGYLTEQDQQIISRQILPSMWYPFESYRNIFAAVVKETANNDMETVFKWGRLYGEKIVREVYSSLIADSGPAEVAKKYRIIFKSFFDFGEFKLELPAPNQVLLTIRDFAPDFEPFFHIARGWVERSFELAGAKNVQSEFLSKSWEGAPETIIKFSWTA